MIRPTKYFDKKFIGYSWVLVRNHSIVNYIQMHALLYDIDIFPWHLLVIHSYSIALALELAHVRISHNHT